MSTGVRKIIIDVGAKESTNKTVSTGRNLIKTNVEKDKNIESGDFDDDIERKGDNSVS